ncbi:MAG TPA: STAS-like domain-containing protein [Prolixibacteraceae bacterium]|jgi:hypothetical protein
MENITLGIVNTVGDSACVNAEDGQRVFELIKETFAEGRMVTLSFLNVEMLASDFLTTAIGQLYRDFSVQFIKENLKIEDLSLTGAVSLKRVVDTAKSLYNDLQANAK